MDYKAVFVDLDKTLLDSSKSISSFSIDIIQKLIARGIDFVPCSGRSLKSLPEILYEIDGIKYSVTSNGVSIDDMQAGKSLSMLYIPCDFFEKIFEFLKDEDVLYECFIDGQGYTPSEYFKDPHKFDNVTFRVEYILTTRVPVDNIKAFILENRDKIGSLDIVIHPEDTRRIFEKLRREFGETVYMTNSEVFLVEISNKDCGKHNGIKRFCQMKGISTGETIAFGDGNNDIEMLEAAGLAVAMGNATDECKAVANRVVETNDDDGVAKELVRIFGI